MIQVHGTCVEVGGLAVLLRGPPGSGKSDLALRLIDRGARLVADDRVDLRSRGKKLIASAPQPIAGRIEVRGLGIVEVSAVAEARLALVVDLVASGGAERMPDPAACDFLGIEVRRIELAPFEASAAAKVRMATRSLAHPPAEAAL
ncbi:MAG TPA: HPr kinase/phosphatase C-terminal domain-containing protein [Alphaproteobacteria bacterium]|nr:HPr kinase/phosphatase C-terminal domain-containing protein [Alphaproteobacteria bacterium]